MLVFLAIIISWFKGLGHSHAITEKKLDAMASFMEDMGIDSRVPKARKAAVGMLVKVHGYNPVFKAQLQTKANRLARKARRLDNNTAFNCNYIAHLQRLIDRDERKASKLDVQRTSIIAKKEAWS